MGPKKAGGKKAAKAGVDQKQGAAPPPAEGAEGEDVYSLDAEMAREQKELAEKKKPAKPKKGTSQESAASSGEKGKGTKGRKRAIKPKPVAQEAIEDQLTDEVQSEEENDVSVSPPKKPKAPVDDSEENCSSSEDEPVQKSGKQAKGKVAKKAASATLKEVSNSRKEPTRMNPGRGCKTEADYGDAMPGGSGSGQEEQGKKGKGKAKPKKKQDAQTAVDSEDEEMGDEAPVAAKVEKGKKAAKKPEGEKVAKGRGKKKN